jgi:MOSC domain-containing protein YiiM
MTYAARLISVNVGTPRSFVRDDREVSTGIFKQPVVGRVRVGTLGVEGDGQADLTVHGGPDKAVYAYSLANTLHWRDVLDRPDLEAGAFGENLTLDDLPDSVVALGDVLQLGDALLQVTQPRQPCVKLAMKFGLAGLPRRFTRSGRVGFYTRVVEPGEIAAGDMLRCVTREPDPLSIEVLNAALLIERDSNDDLRRALASPSLSSAWRSEIEAKLARS